MAKNINVWRLRCIALYRRGINRRGGIVSGGAKAEKHEKWRHISSKHGAQPSGCVASAANKRVAHGWHGGGK